MKFILSTVLFFASLSSMAANYTIEVQAAAPKTWKIKNGSTVIATAIPNPGSTGGPFIYMSTIDPTLKLNVNVSGVSAVGILGAAFDAPVYFDGPNCDGQGYVLVTGTPPINTVPVGVFFSPSEGQNFYSETATFPSSIPNIQSRKMLGSCEQGTFQAETFLGLRKIHACTVASCGFATGVPLQAVYE